jgi:hypothetical protein
MERLKKITAEFMKRKEEVDELLRLTDKIKAYIKANKVTLIEERKQAEIRIFEIQVQHNEKLRKTIESKKLSS